MIIAPTEPIQLRALGKTALTPESYGADILFTSRGKLIGIQRKDYNDLLNSIYDGRIQKELLQMKYLDYPALIIEGEPTFSTDGIYLRNGHQGKRPWNRKAHQNFIASVQFRHITVFQTTDLSDTIDLIEGLHDWLDQDPEASGLLARPKPQGSWGITTNADYGSHLLQSFRTLGPVGAKAIYDHFHGVPLAWTCTEAEMLEVKGIGKKTVAELFKALAKVGS